MVEYARNADDDYQALDDDHYTGNGDEYSPSNKSNTTTSVFHHDEWSKEDLKAMGLKTHMPTKL